MLEELASVAKPGSLVYIISDYHDIDQTCAKALAKLAQHCDIAMLHIYDPLEAQLPDNMSGTLSDGQHQYTLSRFDTSLREAFRNSWQQQQTTLHELALHYKAQYAALSTHHALQTHLSRIFQTKTSRKTRRIQHA